MNTFIGLALVFTSVVLSVTGLILVRRKVDLKTLIKCHEVGGFLFAAIGTLYAVLLGLLVVDSLSRYQDAAHKVEEEANSVANIYLIADALSNPKKTEIQTNCGNYCAQVVDDEWPAMSMGKYSSAARKAALKLVQSVYTIKPADEAESQLAQTAMGQACEFWNNRRYRNVTCTHSIPPIEWAVLIIGAFVTIIFTYFFALENLTIQIVMTALVALMTSLNMFLFHEFAEPHRGGFAIRSDSFTGNQHIFNDDLDSLPELRSLRKQNDKS